jgi:hypothetical protein
MRHAEGNMRHAEGNHRESCARSAEGAPDLLPAAFLALAAAEELRRRTREALRLVRGLRAAMPMRAGGRPHACAVASCAAGAA